LPGARIGMVRRLGSRSACGQHEWATTRRGSERGSAWSPARCCRSSVRSSVEAWFWRDSLSSTEPKASGYGSFACRRQLATWPPPISRRRPRRTIAAGRVPMNKMETATYVVGRQKTLGRFRTRPWSSDFRCTVRPWGAVSRAFGGRGTNQMTSSSSPTRCRSAVSEFMAAVGAQILRTALTDERRRPESAPLPAHAVDGAGSRRACQQRAALSASGPPRPSLTRQRASIQRLRRRASRVRISGSRNVLASNALP
jgi:hypothetical protein